MPRGCETKRTHFPTLVLVPAALIGQWVADCDNLIGTKLNLMVYFASDSQTPKTQKARTITSKLHGLKHYLDGLISEIFGHVASSDQIKTLRLSNRSMRRGPRPLRPLLFNLEKTGRFGIIY
jgi:SNF2 family DNA or RNA helicase